MSSTPEGVVSHMSSILQLRHRVPLLRLSLGCFQELPQFGDFVLVTLLLLTEGVTTALRREVDLQIGRNPLYALQEGDPEFICLQ